jgi:hypothetical protein
LFFGVSYYLIDAIFTPAAAPSFPPSGPVAPARPPRPWTTSPRLADYGVPGCTRPLS